MVEEMALFLFPPDLSKTASEHIGKFQIELYSQCDTLDSEALCALIEP